VDCIAAIRLRSALQRSYTYTAACTCTHCAHYSTLAGLQLVATGGITVVAASDAARRALSDALKDHLPVLKLHWLALCIDAVRLLQGQGLWPKVTLHNESICSQFVLHFNVLTTIYVVIYIGSSQ
jgi:hypothetical protein